MMFSTNWKEDIILLGYIVFIFCICSVLSLWDGIVDLFQNSKGN